MTNKVKATTAPIPTPRPKTTAPLADCPPKGTPAAATTAATPAPAQPKAGTDGLTLAAPPTQVVVGKGDTLSAKHADEVKFHQLEKRNCLFVWGEVTLD